MTLHVLIVEDNKAFVTELRETIDKLPGEKTIQVAGSREQAYEKLEDGFLDLVILDLKIPTLTGALDADPEHGHNVFNKIRSIAPGTPIVVLTGSPVEDFVQNLLRNHQNIDIWGEGQKTDTIRFLQKLHFDRCPTILSPIANAIESLSDVELSLGSISLTLAEDRLIRIFAKKYQGVRCVVSSLGGGLSDARVIRLKVTDINGSLVHDAVAKLSIHDNVRREGDCYDNHVIRLAPEATPRKLTTLEFGAHNLAGVFFGLADGFDRSAFDIAKDEPEQSEEVISRVKVAMARWIDDVPEKRKSIREIRQQLLCDEDLDSIRKNFSLDWVENFENRNVQVRWGCSHGDLHGYNILVSPNRVQLIDYGDICEGPTSLDPMTLELSLLFHPDSPYKNGDWPSTEVAKRWGNLEDYLNGCPYNQFVRSCRSWALQAGAGTRELAASAYSYLVRQLKYEDTNKERVIVLLEGVRTSYDNNT